MNSFFSMTRITGIAAACLAVAVVAGCGKKDNPMAVEPAAKHTAATAGPDTTQTEATVTAPPDTTQTEATVTAPRTPSAV